MSTDFSRIFLRKDRPLPAKGCSVAFFIFFGLLVIALLVFYLIYKQS
ncbi:MAG: hypothetical protein IKS44_03635 [Bacteroidales bacterium]|nr:hypothetical protein [Bacteroidales bacterium]